MTDHVKSKLCRQKKPLIVYLASLQRCRDINGSILLSSFRLGVATSHASVVTSKAVFFNGGFGVGVVTTQPIVATSVAIH